MLKVLFITSVTHTKSHKNLNHFQRAFFLSRYTDLTILALKGANFSASAKPGTQVVYPPWPGKLGIIILVFFWLFTYKRMKFNVVLTEPSILGVCGFLLKVFRGWKWAVDIWDIPIRCNLKDRNVFSLRPNILRILMKHIYKFADLFIVSILPNFELNYFNLPDRKLLFLRNAIWPDSQSGKPVSYNNRKSFDILCMRSFYTSDMGLDTLTQAFLILQKKIKHLSLTIVGVIPEVVEYQIKAVEGLENVRFYGFVEHDVIKKAILSASVCIVPFRDVPDLSQTYPVKVLEYLSMGKPVIASRIAGLMTMIDDGKNGLLFNANDANDLAEKISKLYSNNELRAKISNNARVLDDEYNCIKKNKIIINKLAQLVTD
jgi:glycosyltransferase involved in cell wall biosynthesis